LKINESSVPGNLITLQKTSSLSLSLSLYLKPKLKDEVSDPPSLPRRRLRSLQPPPRVMESLRLGLTVPSDLQDLIGDETIF
ncbi:hypothetical protein HID58_003458, partial [Brassica napus]